MSLEMVKDIRGGRIDVEVTELADEKVVAVLVGDTRFVQFGPMERELGAAVMTLDEFSSMVDELAAFRDKLVPASA